MKRDQHGQVLPLVAGFTLIVFAIAGVAVDGARQWLFRRGLQNSADAAAVAAAAQLDAGSFYAGGGTDVVLHRASAVAEAQRVLASRDLATQSSITVEGDLVRTQVRGRIRTSFLSLVGVDELTVVATATATPVLGHAP